jgi:hypothetical protein
MHAVPLLTEIMKTHAAIRCGVVMRLGVACNKVKRREDTERCGHKAGEKDERAFHSLITNRTSQCSCSVVVTPRRASRGRATYV